MPVTPAPLPQAPLDDRQRLACLRLIRSENIGPSSFRELINRFGGADKALEALPDLVRKGGGRTIRLCARDAAERELDAAARAGASPVFTIEPGYPPLLAHIELPPPMLYIKGHAGLLMRTAVAIVGSRNASAIGMKLTRRIARDLGEAGFVIVSGLARGIDAAAHDASLATGTVAVLAGGIDIVYPPEHAALQDHIGAHGCLVTELPPGFQPRAQEFPRRNRIVSGMVLGVVVMEAARRSGSLITARFAGEHGREVFAVPGHPLDPRAEGVNHLLKNGATLATCAQDIVAALQPALGRPQWGWRSPEADSEFASAPPGQVSPVEHRPDPSPRARAQRIRSTASENPGDGDRQAVLSMLGAAPVSLDDVARESGLPIHVVQAVVLELAVAGRIDRHGGQLVSLRPVPSEE
jgi:DNA processing protein